MTLEVLCSKVFGRSKCVLLAFWYQAGVLAKVESAQCVLFNDDLVFGFYFAEFLIRAFVDNIGDVFVWFD